MAELEPPPLRDWPLAEREALLDYLLETKRVALAAVLRLAAATRQQLLGY